MITIDDRSFIERVLAPFEAGSPGGSDPREDTSPQSLYYRLRDARAEARDGERATDNTFVSDGRGGSAWNDVEQLAVEILTKSGKDLEVASWLAEALARRHGLNGLAIGAEILAGLVESYWEIGLFPAEEVDYPGERVASVSGLSGSDRDGSLMQPLRKLVLFEMPDGSPIALWQYERIVSIATLGEQARKQQHDKTGLPTFDVVESMARTIGRTSLTAIGSDVQTALHAWRAMEAGFARVATDHGPSTGRVTALLVEMERIVTRYVPIEELAAEPKPEEIPETAAEEDVTEPEPGKATPTQRPAPATREELLDEILRIALLFRNNEPNSPISYTLEEAVRRARLPLPELLRELLPELPSRIGVLTGLGMRPPTE